MKSVYILDACALLAYFNGEQGAVVILDCLHGLSDGSILLLMHKINLLEVYYNLYREHGRILADEVLIDVITSGISIIDTISDVVFTTAGRLKGTHKISLGDAVLLAQASASGAAVLTCDHHEFDPVALIEPIVFKWIR
jgi:PIN domain nuclease of toxin-antitoxin system